MNFSQIANKLRNKITKFSGILSADLDKTCRRFIQEAVYGIIASQSVMLTEIGRQLESSVSLKKTVERFSRQLIKPQIWERQHKRLLAMAGKQVKDRTLLILDLSDLKKKYAEKMEYLATVRDGSEDGEYVDGYWTNQVIAAEVGSNEIIPLYHALYSQTSTDFVSENEEIIKAMDLVGNAAQNRGIWVIDRGADRASLFDSLLKNKRDFIIRIKNNRDLVHDGKAIRSLWLAHACRLPHNKTIVRIIHGEEKSFPLNYGCMRVYLPDSKDSLTMVVVKGFSSQPMILLTSLKVNPTQKDIWFIVEAYIKRWSIEETIRFIKRSYDLENIRVLKYTRLQNMMALVLVVFYFVAVILDQSQKLTIMTGHVLRSAKRVFGIPDFKYYALGDGLSKIFSQYPGKLLKPARISDSQLSFGFG
jgi:hypothetical protein